MYLVQGRRHDRVCRDFSVLIKKQLQLRQMDLPVFKMTKGQDIKLQRQMQLRFPKDSHLNRAYFDTKKAKYIVVYWRDCGLSLDMSPKTLRFRKKKKRRRRRNVLVT